MAPQRLSIATKSPMQISIPVRFGSAEASESIHASAETMTHRDFAVAEEFPMCGKGLAGEGLSGENRFETI